MDVHCNHGIYIMKEPITIDATACGMDVAVNQAWTIIHNAIIELRTEGISKEDIRIWMPLTMMRFIGSAYGGMTQAIQVPIMKLDDINVLYGYEHNTIVVSHIQAELFDHEPTTVVVKIL